MLHVPIHTTCLNERVKTLKDYESVKSLYEEALPVDSKEIHKINVVAPSLTPSCPVFNTPFSPQAPGLPIDTENTLLMDDVFLELCLQEIDGTINVPTISSGDTLSVVNQEGTNDPIGIMDNPLSDNFTDLSILLDSSSLSHPFLTSPRNQHTEITFEISDDVLGMESPSSTLTPSSLSYPCSPLDSFTVPSTPTFERKRKASTTSEEVMPSPKTPCETKYIERRTKNNIASQVSRAKRRKRTKNMFTREKELEVENARLRLQVEEMEKEAAKLKKLLITKLAN